MTPKFSLRKRLASLAEVGREGKRFHAFYKGFRARQAGSGENPYEPGTSEHDSWEAGWGYAREKEGTP